MAYSFYENDNRVARYAEALAGRGDRVDVISLRRPGQAPRGRSKGVEVYRLQRRSRGEKAAWVYLLKILWFFVKALGLLSLTGWRKRYDVVHVHNVPDFLVFTALVPKLLGARIVLDIHDLVPELYDGKFGAQKQSRMFRTLLLAERLSCRFADHVVVANHLWHERVIRRSVPASRCTPILNYPDAEFFSDVSLKSTRPAGSFLFLYPGTLNYHQGVDIAVAAFAQICDRMPKAEFHIYGEGPARESLARLVSSLGMGDRVVIRDPVPLHEVPRLMASADVGLVPKRADGFGNEAFSTKILEFMARGVPVIVSRTRVDAHYFHEQIVRFFTPGDARDLARQMLWAYEHPQELRHVGALGNQHAQEYSWQRHAHEYVDMIDRLTCAGAAAATAEVVARGTHGASR